jgi:hypothetical protein
MSLRPIDLVTQIDHELSEMRGGDEVVFED